MKLQRKFEISYIVTDYVAYYEFALYKLRICVYHSSALKEH